MIDYITPLGGMRGAPADRRRLVLLGSTGSIGTSALKVCERHAERFEVLALAGGRNVRVLAEQAAKFRPRYLAVLDEALALELRGLLPAGYAPEILAGAQAYIELARLPEADMVLSAIVGAAGLAPTWSAVRAGKAVALANKESLVLAGSLIREEARRTGSAILPVDSEHNALFQAVAGEDERSVTRLILTASGGPFRGRRREELEGVTREQALKHPNWSMGAKITIDSATLMNKGLEWIEACHLYGLDPSLLEVVVHPQSIVHSLAEFTDGSVLGHMGPPDMMVAIAYCLGFPERLTTGLPRLDLVKLGSLTFEAPDTRAFPCLRLAKEAYLAGPSHCVALNAANEVAVELFLKGELTFLGIPQLIEDVLSRHTAQAVPDVDSILELDRRARADARAAAMPA